MTVTSNSNYLNRYWRRRIIIIVYFCTWIVRIVPCIGIIRIKPCTSNNLWNRKIWVCKVLSSFIWNKHYKWNVEAYKAKKNTELIHKRIENNKLKPILYTQELPTSVFKQQVRKSTLVYIVDKNSNKCKNQTYLKNICERKMVYPFFLL